MGRPQYTYYTEDWAIYPDVIPPAQHVVGKSGTQLLESNNANTRHRVARFTRGTKVVSKSAKMVDLTMRLWAYFEQNHNFAEFQKKFLCILG
ncbi:MAG: IS1 family transposase [Desulfobacteraceae bacterium]